MDFLKDIVKEIGDDYTQLAADIEEEEQLSYNNYNDISAALTISKSLPKNIGTVIVKHTNPSGISINKNKIQSFKLALGSDPISAFGGN